MTSDICERKHKGADTSVAAFKKSRKRHPKDREDIRFAVTFEGPYGLTAKEYAARSGRPIHTISGRFSELGQDREIFKTSRRRDGSAVWIGK